VEHTVVSVWDKSSTLDDKGQVTSSRKLWADVSYHAATGNLYETRDGKRWRNGYGDEFSYRDRKDVPLSDFLERVEYYAKRGYVLVFRFGY
jgi:hypothetical protein